MIVNIYYSSLFFVYTGVQISRYRFSIMLNNIQMGPTEFHKLKYIVIKFKQQNNIK